MRSTIYFLSLVNYKISNKIPEDGNPIDENPTTNPVDNEFFKENSQDANGVVLFTTTPNQLNWRDVKSAFIQANLGWVERVTLSQWKVQKSLHLHRREQVEL